MKKLLPFAITLVLAGCQNMESAMPWINMGNEMAKNAGYNTDEKLAAGIKEALIKGTDVAANQLSQEGAMNMKLPKSADPVTNTLRNFGLGSYVDQLETAMNRGAEKAVASGAPVFKDAINAMSVEDALGIIQGGDTAATTYFRGETESSLRERFQPIVEDNLRQTGFYDQYQTMLGTYNKLPLTNKPNLDLESYVIDNSMNELYTRIGEQETLIRQNPMQQGSALIGAVFGNAN
ncbi:MAG: hypothetical protein AOY29_08435 [Alcanivorax borkumensis]|uniref:DUF4197 domain-containing protein n=1 Tax=Alcanivorax borkumensis (strain ATCC 700651 / DSM 11573 / NCIMB 13689 / SK2) TaxID=393595 RepID=Q0VTG2_ALCBS|nr:MULTISPECIES: DUF4197 domain-containing protein [Alcanivorax]EUC70725.1 hypothetical protein Y017_06945 [Alcanivorax sp. 97CO-5]OJH08825.1 MAG: hypothetical protein AOY29_08435 [Alcanivorax borkumensis]BAP12905.1 hypothetical protein AS19_00540 [Alcanivorax sp. NBRC 101098]CAL15500.1 conserved hypothetical protein [Alcanivorax borkumensis SK2]